MINKVFAINGRTFYEVKDENGKLLRGQEIFDYIERLEKALDKACNDWEEELRDCGYFMMKNNICNQKCVLCRKNKRIKLLKEWCMKNETDSSKIK